MQTYKSSMIVLLSDVNSSPQLLRILQKLHLNNLLFEVIFFGDKWMILPTQLEELGIKVKYISRKRKIRTLFQFLIVGTYIFKQKPKKVFASGQVASIIGVLSAKFLRIKHRIFIRHHSVLHHEKNMKLGLFLDKLTNAASTNIIAVSEVVVKVLTLKENVPIRKIVVIPNGIKLEDYKNIYQQKTTIPGYSISKANRFEIGVISRMTNWKGVEYTAKAFVELRKIYPQAFLHIVGAFSDSYSTIMGILEEIDHDSYLVESATTDVPKYFSNLDLFIHVPVNREVEAFGLVYVEALASKVPCVFTVSGIINQLKNPNDFIHIVPFKDSKEILMQMIEIVESEKPMKQVIPSDWIKQFDLEAMSDNYLEVLFND